MRTISIHLDDETAAAFESLAAHWHETQQHTARVLFAAGLQRAMSLAMCRRCGCTDDFACDEGCEWVAEDLCSACDDSSAKEE